MAANAAAMSANGMLKRMNLRLRLAAAAADGSAALGFFSRRLMLPLPWLC
ncbi:hypothetical protein ACFPRL_31290 [Pseudoclavibacter helvolus]